MPKKQDPNWTTKDPNGIFTSDESDVDKPTTDTPAIDGIFPTMPAYDDETREESDNGPGTDCTSASDECEETASDEPLSDEAESDEERKSDASASSTLSQRSPVPPTVSHDTC